jgi:two-component system phosphate regulon sensor histidine kinase PhoR
MTTRSVVPNPDELKQRVVQLEQQIALLTQERDNIREIARKRTEELEAENLELHSKNQALEDKVQSGEKSARAESTLDVAPINEADVTLRRLVQRIAMILQAEKIAIMFYDREKAELIGIPPAYGIEEDRLKAFRVRATQGISGQVFREARPAMFNDAIGDPRTQHDPFALLHIQNGITVPLLIEKRDEENRVIDRNIIGVLHSFNKRHGEEFNEEDVRLLERMARNVGSIIANLQLYREVVEEREELLQTFESLTAGLILISPDARISQINATARTIFSAEQDVVGKSAWEVLQMDSLKAVFEQANKGMEVGKIDFSVNIAGVERTYEVQAALVRSEEGKDLGVVAIFMDITELRNVDKMKSSFVAMASHELRTPLTAVKGFVSTLLMDDGFSADERREFYSIIDQECDRLTRLINDLLNTARIEAGQSLKPDYRNVDLNVLLEKVVLIQQQTTSRHRIVEDNPDPLPQIVADLDKLDQVLTNLLNNAIKYSPNGGTITVHGKVDGDHVLLGVQDEGLGLAPDQLTRVFERFHRVNNEDNRRIYGTGLGLYLVKHLVERVHLGKIWVESQLGAGSTFWVRIPISLDVEHALAINSD